VAARVVPLIVLLAACEGDPLVRVAPTDAAPLAASCDASAHDAAAGARPDAGLELDAGVGLDAELPDTGAELDAAALDAGDAPEGACVWSCAPPIGDCVITRIRAFGDCWNPHGCGQAPPGCDPSCAWLSGPVSAPACE
jgi:hypothetical protein